MDKDKFDRELKKIMENKTFVNALMVLLAIAFLWLAYTTFFGSSTKGNDQNTPKGAKEVSANEDEISQ